MARARLDLGAHALKPGADLPSTEGERLVGERDGRPARAGEAR